MKTIQKILLFYMLIPAHDAMAQKMERIVDLRGYWKFNIGDQTEWAQPDFDDSKWHDMFVPSAWENEGFHGYDGYAWYRVGFKLEKALNQANGLFIDLGYIDDVDEVYINGELIGYTGSFPPDFRTAFNSRRLYFIPRRLISFDRVNTIAVRVYDTVIDGGILSGRIGIYQKQNEVQEALILEGLWKFNKGVDDRWQDPEFDDADWEGIMVPSFWRGYKKMRVRDFATYRKRFTLPRHLSVEQDLVIVLGKIDDFDKVFLNGHLIGSTNDRRPFGISGSYQVTRVYQLDNQYLNRGGPNVITIEVEDMGGDAGIYEGPIGIVPRSLYRQFIRD